MAKKTCWFPDDLYQRAKIVQIDYDKSPIPCPATDLAQLHILFYSSKGSWLDRSELGRQLTPILEHAKDLKTEGANTTCLEDVEKKMLALFKTLPNPHIDATANPHLAAATRKTSCCDTFLTGVAAVFRKMCPRRPEVNEDESRPQAQP